MKKIPEMCKTSYPQHQLFSFGDPLLLACTATDVEITTTFFMAAYAYLDTKSTCCSSAYCKLLECCWLGNKIKKVAFIFLVIIYMIQ